MARDFIKVSRDFTASPHAATLIDYKETLRRAYELGLKCRAIMSHNNDGSVFADVESLFGLPIGKGNVVFDLVNGSVGAMEGTFQTADAKNLTETVG